MGCPGLATWMMRCGAPGCRPFGAQAEIDDVGPASPGELTHGHRHGTTIIDSIAKNRPQHLGEKIQPVDVDGNSETTTSFDVANGESSRRFKPRANIINLSLGGTGDRRFAPQRHHTRWPNRDPHLLRRREF